MRLRIYTICDDVCYLLGLVLATLQIKLVHGELELRKLGLL